MIGVSILKSISCTKISRRSQCISLLNSFLGRFCKLLSLSDFTSNFRSNALASSTLVLGSCYYLLNIFRIGILLHLFTLMHVIPCHQSHPNEWNHPSMKGMPQALYTFQKRMHHSSISTLMDGCPTPHTPSWKGCTIHASTLSHSFQSYPYLLVPVHPMSSLMLKCW